MRFVNSLAAIVWVSLCPALSKHRPSFFVGFYHFSSFSGAIHQRPFVTRNDGYLCGHCGEILQMETSAISEKKGRFDEVLGSRYVNQLCGAVTYLARRGILHRDIKPGNVFIC